MRFTERRARTLVLALALTLVLATWLACGEPPEPPAQSKAREYTQRFYDGDLAALHELFTAELARDITFSNFVEMHRSVSEQLGQETAVLSESVEVKPPYHRYLRRARFERYAGEVEVNWVLRDDDHAIAGVVFRPVARPGEGGTER